MNTGLPPVITVSRLRRHNRRCLLQAALFFAGSLAMAGIFAILGWCLWGMVTGEMKLSTLSWRGMLFMALFSTALLRWGWRYLARENSSRWADYQTHEAVDPGVRIARKMEDGFVSGGGGIQTYLLLAPRWFKRALQEWHGRVVVSEEKAEALEEVRRHLAARESWEPVSEFAHHESALQELASLEMVSVREHLDQWYVRVALAGQMQKDSVEGLEIET